MAADMDMGRVVEDDEPPLDPAQARDLIRASENKLGNEVRLDSPWLSLFGAFGVLVAYGSLYMATRDQHPYVGPRGLWLITIPVIVIGAITLNVAVYDRLAKTVSGPSTRRRRWFGLVIAVAVVCIYTLNGALKNAGAGNDLVYGIFDAAGPLVVLDYLTLLASLAIACVATGAAFAGPHGVWGVIAIGGFAVLVARTAAKLAWNRGWRPQFGGPITGPGASL